MKLAHGLPILTTLVAAVSGVSCADIASPARSTAYEWRLFSPNSTGTTDTLSFHWPSSRLPVKVWAQDTLSLPGHVQAGIDQWKASFLYGEFDAVVVGDSNVADVIVSAGDALKGGFSVARLESTLAPQCEGGTDFELPPGSKEMQPPVRIFVHLRVTADAPGVDQCLALTTTHELGHSIGIFAHSPEVTDLMFADPIVTAPSERDRATAELVYHTEPTLTMGTR
jgi:predicted Zn-dependent protease